MRPAFVGVWVADGGGRVAGSGPTGWEDGALVGDPERPADVGDAVGRRRSPGWWRRGWP